jgi:hypothetical protein
MAISGSTTATAPAPAPSSLIAAVSGSAQGRQALATITTGAAAARQRTLPMLPALAGALPAVQRGWVISCDGPAAASMALLAAAGPSQQGRWVACAGWPQLNLQAARELGVALERVVAVPHIPTATGVAADVLAAMIDGFEVVITSGAALTAINAGVARTLHARAGTRGAVVFVVGPRQPFAADITVTARPRWFGLGDGAGVVQARQLEIVVGGRRAPQRRVTTVWAPDQHGTIAAAGDVELAAPQDHHHLGTVAS